MTIHSDWARLLRDECPEAFYAQPPDDVAFDVGVIDGHLQLMCLHAGFGTWEVFLHALFVRPIERMFAAGCKTAVLCFDAYEHVPAYKAMTQLKRVQAHGSTAAFDAHQALPLDIPADAMGFLLNRNFKLRVVEYVCALLPLRVKLEAHQRLLIDYRRVIEYTPALSAGAPVPDLVSMGESDVKFVRYVERHGNALVHAVDGDYMAIALLYYATCGGLRGDNRIFLFRQGSAMAKEEEEGGGGRKRKKACGNAAALSEEEEKKTPTRHAKKCWVDMQLLYITIAQHVRLAGARQLPCENDGAAVYACVSLMLCAGTDFSRGLPLLGPKRMWEHLPLVADALLEGAHATTGLDVQLLALEVVEALYGAVFSRHVTSRCGGGALAQLRATSRLAASTVARLPSDAQIHTTLRNVAWVMRYWRAYNSVVPAPLDGSNGFVRCPVTGRPVFADCTPRACD